MELELTWELEQMDANKETYGISYFVVAGVFYDNNHMKIRNIDYDIDENYYFVIGSVNNHIIAVSIIENDTVQVKAARLATDKEKVVYYGQELSGDSGYHLSDLELSSELELAVQRNVAPNEDFPELSPMMLKLLKSTVTHCYTDGEVHMLETYRYKKGSPIPQDLLDEMEARFVELGESQPDEDCPEITEEIYETIKCFIRQHNYIQRSK